MTSPVVWTERNTGQVGWTDCTWCSILMVVVGSGHTAFPLGVYTEAERKAFRAGDPRLNFSGGVERAKARYGVTITSPPPYSQAGLRAALSSPGRVYAVAGKLSNFPAGHPLRRWQPGFSGTHAIAIVPLGGGKVTWLDPLAPNKFAGDTATVADVVDVFAHYPNDARYMAAAKGADMTTIVNATLFLGADGKPAPRAVSFAAGSYTGYALDGTTKVVTLARASSAPADATCVVTQQPDRSPHGNCIRIIAGSFATHPYLGYPAAGITVAPDPVPTPPATGITPDQAQALARKAAHEAAEDVAAHHDGLAAYAADKYPG